MSRVKSLVYTSSWSVDPSEILHYLDGVLHRGRHPASTTAGVQSLEPCHHLRHGGSGEDDTGWDLFNLSPQDSPVQVKEGLDEISVNESLAGLVFLLTGERSPVVVVNTTDRFDNFAQPSLKLLQEIVEFLRQLSHQTDGPTNTS